MNSFAAVRHERDRRGVLERFHLEMSRSGVERDAAATQERTQFACPSSGMKSEDRNMMFWLADVSI